MDHMIEATAPTDTVAAFYDGSAPLYDAMTDMESRIVGDRPFVRVFVERYGIRTALDAGSGTGMLSLLLADLGVRVTAVDIADAMLKRLQSNAQRRGVTVRTIAADLVHLPIVKVGKVNAVFCLGNTLAHVLTTEDLTHALSNFRLIIADKGIVMIHLLNFSMVAMDRETELNVRVREGKVFRRSYRPHDGLLEFSMEVKMQDGGESHVQTVIHRPWSEGEMRDALDEAGFVDVQWFGGIDLREFVPKKSRDAFIIAKPAGMATHAL